MKWTNVLNKKDIIAIYVVIFTVIFGIGSSYIVLLKLLLRFCETSLAMSITGILCPKRVEYHRKSIE